MAQRWYIVNAHANFEKRVAESILDSAEKTGLDKRITEVLVPVEKVQQRIKGKDVTTERKFFPGYVLVCMDMNDDAYHLIKNTPKVTGFLGNDNKPMPITKKEVDRIVNRNPETAEKIVHNVIYEIGEQVLVCDGPFANFSGLVEDVDEERARLKVAVSIFGRPTPVELEYGQVKKVDS